jgi:hypothetical protein
VATFALNLRFAMLSTLEVFMQHRTDRRYVGLHNRRPEVPGQALQGEETQRTATTTEPAQQLASAYSA